MHTWQLQEAKAQLSELVRLCSSEGPQVLTVRGKETAILISKEEYERIIGNKPKFTDLMKQSPLRGVDLKLKRDKSKGRKVDL